MRVVFLLSYDYILCEDLTLTTEAYWGSNPNYPGWGPSALPLRYPTILYNYSC